MKSADPVADCASSSLRGSTLEDLRAGLKQGLLLGAAIATLLLPPIGSNQVRASAAREIDAVVADAGVTSRLAGHADFEGGDPSPDTRRLADWVADSGDNGGLAFAIIDKRGARLYVFNHDARLLSSSLVLLGSAIGDDSAPGIGNRPLAQVLPDERTTAAGRFVSEPGHDETGERVIWVDYAAALAMHRVKVVDPKERRFERIATASITDKRISNGCINIPVAFFDAVVEPALGRSRAIVYVLPEVKPLRHVFPAIEVVSAGFATGKRVP